MQEKSKENKQEKEIVIGDIVTLKTHPLLYGFKIKGDGKLVPPFMIVKEIYIEDKKKKTHSEELGEQIAERIKYTCVFFDDNKTEFKEAILYESMLEKYDKIHIARLDKNKKEVKCDSLIDETRKYVIPEYNYGDIVFFRTKKFEIFKKRDSSKMIQQKGGDYKKTTNIQYIVNYSSPDFILCGIKKNENTNDFYPNGDKRRIVSEILYKVKWFNTNQMKFSDIYLPRECFTDIQ
ncbi:hypothetical protein J2Q11_07945 [Tenacibaculum finnmarkense genomovar finnmarkense]|uniref:hypothetical protein n=1 Tax=Tenacibaculum finnmarkense TaxID=2781243 RepID=UPI001E291BBC|nr:hypothetical protein [Tenacibaculum finnmarkense]MCD8417566.1 hypothetical protein [Tenacibaculum finnmarkense genomovar finnmarkense]MCG8185995.1 hypothetical protein [Tenacibaculum finnmarkense genomovar finnmarkense]MCG8202505.1 hypothetical protein [Tenacibaculum finnmarkense genomovar finnmarkense]MCG8209836.1 hypothetical protein [Tenacibaculum finnmarkense genomovar finnmarkense]MCG8212706.1 hypothetical protein [Tenacibaculum finnmarkense genomovar finnmarkense]